MATAEYGTLLEALRGVRWPARRRSDAPLPGAHASRRHGRSTEYTEHRPYRQGDDPRRLDWRLLARTDRAYVRLAQDRTTLPLVLVVDASESMAYPIEGRDKWLLARRLAVGLTAVAHSQNDPVGLGIAAAGGTAWQEPRGRRGVISDVARALERASLTGTGQMGSAIAAAPHGARLVLIADMLGDEDAALREAAHRSVAGDEVHVVHVVAEDEIDPGVRSRLAFDPEQPADQRALSGENLAGYLDAFGRWRASVARRCHDARIGYVLARTGENPADIVRRIVGAAPVSTGREPLASSH